MKNIKNKFGMLALAFIVMSLASCEKYLDFDQEIKDPKIVVNSRLNADSTVTVHLSKSLSVIDNADLSAIENATVGIYDANGNLLEALVYDTNGFYRGTQIITEATTYSLKASANGYADVSASDYVPAKVSIISVDTLGVEDVNGYLELELTLTFEDPSDEDNYYQLEVYGGDDFSGQVYYYPYYFRSDEVSLQLEEDSYTNNALFSDELFDGQSKTIVIYVEDTRDYDDFLEIRLTSLSYSAYLYEKSYETYSWNYGNPFAQPVQVYDNIENGFGIFGGATTSRKKISF